jgi:hypothetical protein
MKISAVYTSKSGGVQPESDFSSVPCSYATTETKNEMENLSLTPHYRAWLETGGCLHRCDVRCTHMKPRAAAMLHDHSCSAGFLREPIERKKTRFSWFCFLLGGNPTTAAQKRWQIHRISLQNSRAGEHDRAAFIDLSPTRFMPQPSSHAMLISRLSLMILLLFPIAVRIGNKTNGRTQQCTTGRKCILSCIRVFLVLGLTDRQMCLPCTTTRTEIQPTLEVKQAIGRSYAPISSLSPHLFSISLSLSIKASHHAIASGSKRFRRPCVLHSLPV